MGSKDDPKVDIIMDYLVPHLHKIRADQHALFPSPQTPYYPTIIGLSGCQGSGKSTLASNLGTKLNSEHGFRVAEVSLDDFYLTRSQQQELSSAHLQNPLLRQRGQPGTHDVQLASTFFDQNPESRSCEFRPLCNPVIRCRLLLELQSSSRMQFKSKLT